MCDIKFKSTQSAINHFEEVHLGTKINRKLVRENCKICGKSVRKEVINTHIKQVHEPKEPVSIKCDLCEKVFHSESGLKNHKLVTHEGKRFECNICEEIFMSDRTLKKHIRIVHDGILYQCEQCGQVLTTEEGLRDHVLACLLYTSPSPRD